MNTKHLLVALFLCAPVELAHSQTLTLARGLVSPRSTSAWPIGAVRPRPPRRCGNLSETKYPYDITPSGDINWDLGRQEIEEIVVHSTGHEGPLTLPLLSRWGSERLYGNGRRNIWGCSGHYFHINGVRREVFWGYHYLIWENLQLTQLLPDSAVGRHAGNFEVNLSSIGIAIEGNFLDNGEPSEEVKTALKALIVELLRRYPTIRRVRSHQDARVHDARGRPTTKCPGPWWQEFEASEITPLFFELAVPRDLQVPALRSL